MANPRERALLSVFSKLLIRFRASAQSAVLQPSGKCQCVEAAGVIGHPSYRFALKAWPPGAGA
jgi:hypothetical protein